MKTNLDSSAYIAELTVDFTGREGLVKGIDDWLTRGESRPFLLTGGPGKGKGLACPTRSVAGAVGITYPEN